MLPLAGFGVVLLAVLGDEPPHDAVRTPNDPAAKATAAAQRNRPAASPLTATPSPTRTDPHLQQSLSLRVRGAQTANLGRGQHLCETRCPRAQPARTLSSARARANGVQTPSSVATAQRRANRRGRSFRARTRDGAGVAEPPCICVVPE